MMKNELRVVVDTNILVSALIFESDTPRQALDFVIDSPFGVILISEETVAELDEVIHRPRFDKYLDEEDRFKLIADLRGQAELVSISETISACRDAKDNKILELAVSGKATHIVTGDADLLVMNPFRGIAIVSPQEFLAIVSGKN